MSQSEHSPRQSRNTSLSIEDADGEELLGDEFDEDEAQIVVASDRQGNSLTLLEEYSRRKSARLSPVEFTISFTCAAASLAFAVLLYLNTL